MTTKLEIYNRALDLLGDKRLTSLSERRWARHALDDVYDYALEKCLEQGIWVFALRTAAAVTTTLPTPAHGFKFAYTVPSDKVHTYILFDTASRLKDLDDYTELNGLYLTNANTLYVRYTSGGASYGGDLTKWPVLYTDFVACSLACKLAWTLTRDGELYKKLGEVREMLLLQARATYALLASAGQPAQNAMHRREFNVGANVMEPWPFPVAPVTAVEQR